MIRKCGVLSQALCRIGTPAVEPLGQRLDDADDIPVLCHPDALADGRDRSCMMEKISEGEYGKTSAIPILPFS